MQLQNTEEFLERLTYMTEKNYEFLAPFINGKTELDKVGSDVVMSTIDTMMDAISERLESGDPEELLVLLSLIAFIGWTRKNRYNFV